MEEELHVYRLQTELLDIVFYHILTQWHIGPIFSIVLGLSEIMCVKGTKYFDVGKYELSEQYQVLVWIYSLST